MNWRIILLILQYFFVFSTSSSPYDSSAVFDPSGRLQQLENAHKAARSGGSTIVAKIDRHVVIAKWDNLNSNVLKSPSGVFKLAKSLGLVAGGITSDVNFLADKSFDEVLNSVQRFGTIPSAARIASSIADHMHGKTLSVFTRPYGATLCFFGFDDCALGSEKNIGRTSNTDTATAATSKATSLADSNRVHSKLIEISPSGSCTECNCCFFGTARIYFITFHHCLSRTKFVSFIC